ncbi:MAG: molybdopterin cofactor-binding domain-containing protein [Chloroflexota bacterium]
MAYYATFGVTHVAQEVEVSVTPDGMIRVHRVVWAVDCGAVINPDTVEARMEGGIVFGLTAALKAGITIEKGRTQQSNFHDYPPLRMAEHGPAKICGKPSRRFDG